MPALFFDVVTLHADGVELPTGLRKDFATLGLGETERLVLCARVLTVEGTPPRLPLPAGRADRAASAGPNRAMSNRRPMSAHRSSHASIRIVR